MIKASRIFVVMLAIALTALTVSCGNPLEGGSSPSGSILRVVEIRPVDTRNGTVGPPTSPTEPDLFVTVCTVDEDGTPTMFEQYTNTYVVVNVINESIPNTPTGESTSSYVTINRYRVDFASLDSSIDIPSIDGGGVSVGIPADTPFDDPKSVSVAVMDFTTLDYIRQVHPTASITGDSLRVRADITLWGEDAFKVRVSVKASVTLIIADYNNCG